MPRAILVLLIHLSFLISPLTFPLFVPFLWPSCHNPSSLSRGLEYANENQRDWAGRDFPSLSDGWSTGSLEKAALTMSQGDSPAAWRLGCSSPHCHLCAHRQGKRASHYQGRQEVSGWDGKKERRMEPISIPDYQATHTNDQPMESPDLRGWGCPLCLCFKIACHCMDQWAKASLPLGEPYPPLLKQNQSGSIDRTEPKRPWHKGPVG